MLRVDGNIAAGQLATPARSLGVVPHDPKWISVIGLALLILGSLLVDDNSAVGRLSAEPE
jgi:hypothetical protein